MKLYKLLIAVVAAASVMTSCTKDLDRVPEYGFTNEVLFKNEAGYRSALAKLYAGLALTGNNANGGAGAPDITTITDEGFSSYIRIYWKMQELTTDEAVIGWNDKTIKDFHELDWTPADEFIGGMYSRLFFQITLANNFIRESEDGKVSGRGISGADADKIKDYRNEARFLRALSYYHALDLYGNPTFVTDADGIGAFLPQRTTRAALFNWIEQELLAIEPLMKDPKANEYARADRAAVWMLLANLYLNAQVYIGTEKNTQAVTYSKKVMQAGYTLNNNYAYNFLADNNTSSEVIFPVAFDGTKTRTWGGCTFLVHAPIGGSMSATDYGVDGGWGGLRTTSALVAKFPDPSGATDKRAMFHTAGQTLAIADIAEFSNGYAIKKWKNVKQNGQAGSNLTWVDTDFPMFRLAEANLIFAEAVLRGGTGGTNVEALAAVNALRTRAYGNATGNLGALTLQDVLDERARELYWEGKRRTDLIRFNQFHTNTYLWPWKGGVASGRAVDAYRDLFPIPAAELNSNPNLIQNTGY
ncbi:MAG TPA: RagB/SusD family nutrient uptake outer membrane protein [Chitinophagaceae bacterium]|nr:RagB/SusD family nutrient uptake outer membrane protein [Chitinophagaceae bacterium]